MCGMSVQRRYMGRVGRWKENDIREKSYNYIILKNKKI